MARIALAGFLHETNTFSPIPTDYDSFASRNAPLCGIYVGQELEKEFRGKTLNNAVCGFFEEAAKLGHQVVPLVRIGEAEPSGIMSADLFNRLMVLILDQLSAQAPYDGVYLDLHGAMTYGDYQNGDAEILRRVRQVAGNIPVVASLDLHGNISQEDFNLASALVGYRTYPHVDIFQTGQRCAGLLHHLLQGKPLFKAFRQFPFLMPGSTMPTNHDPCKSLYEQINEMEKNPALLSASIMQGFNQADVEFTGPTVFAYATAQAAAEQAAEHILQHALAHEGEFRDNLPGARQAVSQAIELVKSAAGPVILADVQDNPGGGATSDSVWILQELVRQDAPDTALALLYDPASAAAAHAAGVGAQLTLDLGGKLHPGHTPFHGTFRVEALFEGDFIATGPMIGGMRINLGKMAQLSIGRVRVVVSSFRTQVLDQSYMRVVGVEPASMKILVLKSSNHYRADFEPISSAIINVEAPAATINNPSRTVYARLRPGVRLQGLGVVQPSG